MTHQERLQLYAQQHADRYNAGKRQEYAGGPFLTTEPQCMMDEAEITCKAAEQAIWEVMNTYEEQPDGLMEWLEDNGYTPSNATQRDTEE